MYRKLIFISVCMYYIYTLRLCILRSRSWSIDLIDADRRFHISHPPRKSRLFRRIYCCQSIQSYAQWKSNENQVKTNFAWNSKKKIIFYFHGIIIIINIWGSRFSKKINSIETSVGYSEIQLHNWMNHEFLFA